jgi:hypothetical protein
MPRVWNIRDKDWPAGTVYIGRTARGWPRSKWANPFVVDRDGTREEVIELYEQWLQGNILSVGQRAARLSERRSAALS